MILNRSKGDAKLWGRVHSPNTLKTVSVINVSLLKVYYLAIFGVILRGLC